MDIRDLQPFVLMLIFTGLIIGVGVIVLEGLGDSARSTIAVTNENHTFSTDASVSLTNLQEVESIVLTNFSVTLTLNTDYNTTITASTATILVDGSYNNSQLNASYTYYIDNTATTQMDNVVSAVTPIASTWMGLIITVVILAIILGMIITSFSKAR